MVWTVGFELMNISIPKWKNNPVPIIAEFLDKERPTARYTRVKTGPKRVAIARKSKPSQLTQQVIEEDMSGEEFYKQKEEYEEMINEEEEEFLNISLGDPDRVEYLKKMADEVGQFWSIVMG